VPRSGHAPERTKDILQYFLRHPQAADSLEGMARWRVLDETIHRSVEEINAALTWLVAEGFLVQRAPAGSEPIFYLNCEKADEAVRFLTEAPRRKKSRRGRR